MRDTRVGPLDPFAVLGIEAQASRDEIARAYRELAKRHHPDRAGAGDAGRMAEINAAYAMLRDGSRRPPAAPGGPGTSGGPSRPPRPGAWLDAATRRALGPELVRALEPQEAVLQVVAAATWDSPHVVLVATDRRLLWLRDDAFVNRTRFLPYRAVAAVDSRLARPRRRRGELRVEPREGRRQTFAEIPATTLAGLVQTVRARLG